MKDSRLAVAELAPHLGLSCNSANPAVRLRPVCASTLSGCSEMELLEPPTRRLALPPTPCGATHWIRVEFHSRTGEHSRDPMPLLTSLKVKSTTDAAALGVSSTARLRFGLSGFTNPDTGAVQFAELCVELVDRVPDPEPEVERDLVVARARRVQASGIRADDLGKTRFDIHMNVLEGARKGEGSGLDFAVNLL